MKTGAMNSGAVVASTPESRRFSWPRLFGYDFFISFKLGSPPLGAQSYASDLARRLREEDFTVFFSEEEAPPGAELDKTLIRALNQSSILVVIANQGALTQSQWVRKEVEAFRHKHSRRPIIPINVDCAIEKYGPEVNTDLWLDHAGRIWLNEAAQSVQEGIASPDVVKRLLLAPKFIKANVLFRCLVAMIFAVLIGLGGYAWIKKEESHHRFVEYNLSQGRMALTNGRSLEAAPSLLRAFKEGVDTPALRFMLARAFASVDALMAGFDGNDLVFSADGARFAVALKDGTVQIWGAADWKIITTLPDKLPEARSLLFAPDGATLAVTEGSRLEIGASPILFEGRLGCVSGERINKVSVSLWDVQSGALLNRIRPIGEDAEVCWQSFFFDNAQKLTITGWTTQRTDLYWSMTKFDAAHYTMISAMQQDNKRRCRQYEKALITALLNQEGNGDCPGKVVGISSDGAWMAIAPWELQQRELTLWDVRQGVGHDLSFGNDAEIIGAAFSLGNERLAVSLTRGIELWGAAAQKKMLSIPVDALSLPAEFSPDASRLLAVTAERTVSIFDAADGQRLALLEGHAAPIRVATFSQDGERILTAGDDGVAKVWDAWNGKLLMTLEGHREPIIRAAFSPDLRFIVTKDQGGRIKLWQGRPASMPRQFREDPARVRWWSDAVFDAAYWTHDGNEVIFNYSDYWSRNNESVYALWDTNAAVLTGLWRTAKPAGFLAGKQMAQPAEPDRTKPFPCVQSGEGLDSEEPLALDPRGHRMLMRGDGALARMAFVLDPAGDCRKIPLAGHHSAITAAAFSLDGHFILTADEAGIVRLWDSTNFSVLAVLSGEEHPGKAAFLPDGRALILHERNRAVIWDFSLERRSIPELERLLYCSRLVPDDSLAGISLDDNPGCRPADHLGEPSDVAATFDAARAFLVSGWAMQNRIGSENLLQRAAASYRELNDRFGESVCRLAIRAAAIMANDAERAEAEARSLRELMIGLSQTEDQQARLTRLGEIAFNEFGDGAMARFAYALVLKRIPEDPAAKLGAFETSVLIDRPKDWHKEVSSEDTSSWTGSLRALVIQWVSASLAGQKTDHLALAIWDMYASGITINPIFERLDFRGLRRVIEKARLPKVMQRHILNVLEMIEFPGDHSNTLKRLLHVPEQATAVGP